ncbi:helix-turn-helix transcriptional regulator [Gorillibacterium timonense]|uniref:helix-turn-helix transcriptional regulator n=1 Tax=Gorillibacterium timonense TaxID=1689269 RepID=UPI001F24C1D2|nr:helix-turn-helix transcriptional regulator [Gorillibacterium timonense]
MRIKAKDLELLNRLIIMKGFSKVEFSKAIGMSQPMTIQITNGDRSPSPKTAKKIADVLEREWNDIFEFERSERSVKQAIND